MNWSINLLGYLASPDEKSEYLSLKVAIFSHDGELFIQKIETNSHKIVGFENISKVLYTPLPDFSSVSVKIGDDGIFIFKFNSELIVGNKIFTDQKVSLLLNHYSLTSYNLYSIYTFLGLHDKMVSIIDSIIHDTKKLILSRHNFLIPDEVLVEADNHIFIKQILSYYSNIFFTLREANYHDLFVSSNNNKSFNEVKIGFFRISITAFTEFTDFYINNNPISDSDIRINDFVVGLLIFIRHTIPSNVRIFKYISLELLKSTEYSDNDVVENIKELQVRSSTTYYLSNPTAETNEESFIYASQRIEREQLDYDNERVRYSISQQELDELDKIYEHILENSKIQTLNEQD